MRTDLLPSEAALCRLVRVDRRSLEPVPAEMWPAILYLAERERMAPFVYAAVTELPDEATPESVRMALAQSYRHSAAAAVDASGQLVGLLGAFRTAGLEVLLLKGSALTAGTYRQAGLRPFGDFDLLVRPGDVQAAHAALTRAGYAMVGDAPTADDRTWRHARGYYDPDRRRASVDVHWRYAGYPLIAEINYAEVFARAATVFVGRERALVPSPADMIVALCVHFLRDLWYGKSRLRYLRDVAEVAARHVVAWPHVTDVGRTVPFLRTPLYVALTATAGLIGAAIPQGVLEALNPGGRGAMVRYLTDRVSRNVLRQERPADSLCQVALMRWLDAESFGGYLRWISGLIFVPRGLASSRHRWLRHLWARRPPGGDPGD